MVFLRKTNLLLSLIALVLASSFSSLTSLKSVCVSAASMTMDGTGEEAFNLETALLTDDEYNLAKRIQTVRPMIEESYLMDILELIRSAHMDPGTLDAIDKYRMTGESDKFEAYKTLPAEALVDLMIGKLEEFYKLEKTFMEMEPVDAIEDLHAKGLIPKEKVDVYKEDLDLFEEEYAMGLYRDFLTIGAAGGFI